MHEQNIQDKCSMAKWISMHKVNAKAMQQVYKQVSWDDNREGWQSVVPGSESCPLG